jgi:hypothetical protein
MKSMTVPIKLFIQLQPGVCSLPGSDLEEKDYQKTEKRKFCQSVQ